MVSPRIWVSCAVGDDAQQGMALAQRLVSDLRKAGAEVVSEGVALPDEQFLPLLQQGLARCQWFISVQTPQEMGSRRVQLVVQEVLSHLRRGSLHGAWLVSASSDSWDEPTPWLDIKSYAYNGDYPRLRDKLLLDLNLLQIADVPEEVPGDTVVGMLPPVQETPGSQSQAPRNAERLASFQEHSGELHKSPSSFQLPSPSGGLLKMGSIASKNEHKTQRGDQPGPPPFFLPRPSRRFWLYSIVSILSMVLIVSGVVLAKDMAPASSPSAHPTPITLIRPTSTRPTPTHSAPTPSTPAQPASTQPAAAPPPPSPSSVASQKAGWVFITTSTLSVLDKAGKPQSARCSSQGGTATVPASYNVVAVDNHAYQIAGQTYLHVAYPDPCQPGLDYSSNNAIANGTGAVGWVAQNALVQTKVVRPSGGGAVWRDCWAPNRCGNASYPNTTDTLDSKDAELYAWWTGSYWDVHWWHVLDKSGKQASVYGSDWGAFS